MSDTVELCLLTRLPAYVTRLIPRQLTTIRGLHSFSINLFLYIKFCSVEVDEMFSTCPSYGRLVIFTNVIPSNSIPRSTGSTVLMIL